MPSDHQSAETSNARGTRAIALLIVGVTLAIYLPRLGNTFLEWDFVAYRKILYAADYLSMSLDLFADVKGKIVPGYYAPLSSISLMLDKALIGSAEPSARFTLAVNVALHCLNGLLVFALIRRLGGDRNTALIAELLFLIHPIQVSSILWFSQRKGLLATMLYLIAFLTWLRFRETRSAPYYLVTLLLFVGAVLNKPTVVVFPVALVVTEALFAWAPRRSEAGEEGIPGRDAWSHSSITGASPPSFSAFALTTLKRTLLFFVVAVGLSLVTMESEGVSMDAAQRALPLVERPLVAGAAIWFYVAKMAAPMSLSPIYPQWHVDAHSLLWWFAPASLAAGLIALWFLRARVGFMVLWGVANFLVPLIPVSGLFKFGYLRLSYVADHFLYLSVVGSCVVVAAVLARVRQALHGWTRPVWTIAVFAYLAALGIQSCLYANVWKDSVSLWTYNLKQNPDNWTAHNYLGHALLNSDRPEEAVEHFQRTVKLKEQYVAEHLNRADALEKDGKHQQAAAETALAMDVKRTLPIAYHNLGNSLLLSDRTEEALAAFQQAVALDPSLARAVTNLGIAHLTVGNVADAITWLERAITLQAKNFEAHYNLGSAYQKAGNTEKAQEHFRKARELRPPPATPQRSGQGSW